MENLRLGQTRALRAEALAEEATASLNSWTPDFLSRFPIEAYIAEIEHHGRPHRFYEFTSRALEQTAEMHAAYEKPVVEIFNRLMLARLIADAETRTTHIIAASVQPLVLEDFDRILKGLEKPRPNYYLRDNHLFRRDLALARVKAFANRFELYDIGVRIDRSEALRGGAGKLWRHIKAFQSQMLKPQLGPFYEPHWDRRYIMHFSQLEYERCTVRVADMMIANPDVQAVVAPSWWYDPQLEWVSPEMAFLRAIPASNGARFMRLPAHNVMVDALANSAHRKALHTAGKFNPQSFMMVWPRRELISWASDARTRVFQENQK